MKLIILLLFTTILFAQSSIVPAGGNAQNISYTIGSQLVELQIPIVEDVTLGVPKFEVPEQPKPIIKKKVSFLQIIINFLKTIFK